MTIYIELLGTIELPDIKDVTPIEGGAIIECDKDKYLVTFLDGLILRAT